MATSIVVERRVNNLEIAMAEMARAVAEASRAAGEASRAAGEASRAAGEASRSADRASRAVEQLTQTVEQTSRTAAQTSRELAEFKIEMQAFKTEMQAFKTESQAARREMNQQWGALANKMGTMAEDLVAPSIPRILRTVLGCPGDRIEEMAVRVIRRSRLDRTRSREFDVITACGDWFLINETKSSLDPEDVSDFVEVLSSVREYFPEQAHRQIVGVIASLYVDESLVRYAERSGLIVLSFGDEGMDVRNTAGFAPRLF